MTQAELDAELHNSFLKDGETAAHRCAVPEKRDIDTSPDIGVCNMWSIFL